VEVNIDNARHEFFGDGSKLSTTLAIFQIELWFGRYQQFSNLNFPIFYVVIQISNSFKQPTFGTIVENMNTNIGKQKHGFCP
jgi:hypothetical protein